MKQIFDDAGSEKLEDIFYSEGKVTFLLTRREAILLKRVTKTEMKFAMLKARPSLISKIKFLWYLSYGMLQTTILSFLYQNLENIYAFYALNKRNIRNIDEKKREDGKIVVTYFATRKTEP